MSKKNPKYDNVSDEIIWGILHKNLPALQTEIEDFLEEE
jgi:uncharacterized protein with HEPN domain